MAGKGPPPKPPNRRARRNSDPLPSREVHHAAAPQPKLPAKMPDGSDWPAETRAWWRAWAKSPLAEGLTALEWHELLIAAVLHALYWGGDVRVASELRLRVGKFGMTPEDRLRLRIEFVPEEPEAPQTRRRDLRLVDES
jgi:hypothetical protein